MAAEATIIRFEERKCRGRGHHPSDLFFQLRRHRTWDVRRESRASFIAYGFLRGRPYDAIERPINKPDKRLWDTAQAIAVRFSNEARPIVEQRFAEWKADADRSNRVQPEAKGSLRRPSAAC